MAEGDIHRLVGIGIVVLVAVGSVLALLRLGGKEVSEQLTAGYPPELFPMRELARSAPLLALATTQARLLSIERQLPPRGELRIWLGAFLSELREIMDTAYRVAAITQVYGRPPQLDRLVDEVQRIEAQVAEEVTRRLFERDGDAQSELLDGRLATLRLCVRELALASGMRIEALPTLNTEDL